MNERVKFIAGYLQDDEPFSVLCARAQISRKTGYKWVERYELSGVTGLVDRSRAPLSRPHTVPATVVEERRLFAREAFPSMFAYCMDVLHLSEAEAYLRIAAARASLKHPILLTMLADGRLHLTAIGLLAGHLTRENRDGLLERATHWSKRQIEELIAEIAPRPDVPVVVRKLPQRRTLPMTGLLVAPICGDDLGQGLARAPMLELCSDGEREKQSNSRHSRRGARASGASMCLTSIDE